MAAAITTLLMCFLPIGAFEFKLNIEVELHCNVGNPLQYKFYVERFFKALRLWSSFQRTQWHIVFDGGPYQRPPRVDASLRHSEFLIRKVCNSAFFEWI